MFSLLVDDIRMRNTDFTARTYDEAIHFLQNEEIDTLMLGHDLDDPDPRKTGVAVMKWLCEHTDRLPEHIIFVTDNGPGRDNMISYINSLNKSGYNITYEVEGIA